MKVKSLVKATKEYERLQSLIEKIEKNLKELERPTADYEIYVGGKFLALSCYDGRYADRIEIDSSVTDLIRSGVINLLEAKLVELKKEQEKLEVE